MFQLLIIMTNKSNYSKRSVEVEKRLHSISEKDNERETVNI